MTGRAHLLIVVITALSLTFVLRLVRRRQLRAKYSMLWLSIGVVLLVFAASPRLLDRASTALGIYYAPATFFLAAITLLFLLAIHFSWELTRLEDRTRMLAEEVALLRLELDQRRGEGEAGSLPARPPVPDQETTWNDFPPGSRARR